MHHSLTSGFNEFQSIFAIFQVFINALGERKVFKAGMFKMKFDLVKAVRKYGKQKQAIGLKDV